MRDQYVFDRARLAATIECLQGKKVLVVGDVMVDEYLEGDADRISPEAPIPVVRVAKSRFLLGGAGNVVRNIASLGGETTLISVCGDDAKADLLKSKLVENSVASMLIPVSSRPTTLKTRVIARNQQMLRIDHEETAPLAIKETSKILDAIDRVAGGFDVLVISDYGKGVVTRELMQGVRDICVQAAKRPKLLIDPKTPNFAVYGDAFILTPNAKETSEAAGMPTSSKEEILAAGETIFQKLRCEHLLTTLGDRGMALFLSEKIVWHIPTAAQKVFDVTGAGDTVMAVLAVSLASGAPLLESCVLANYAAGVVVAQVGAGCVSREELQHIVATAPEPAISRWA